jgi:4-aminobutyrate aminotransferase-like enzyme/Ser/Thr protein kinase RdoA (MazF antagonist)
MDINKSIRPKFSGDDVTRILSEIYDIEGTAAELVSERDQNFHIKDTAGNEFVLKIANKDEDYNLLECQNMAMEHLSDYYRASICPGVCYSTSKEGIVNYLDSNGVVYFIRLLKYLPGRVFAGYIEHPSEMITGLGGFIGRLSRAFENFSHPASKRKFHWDIKHADRVIEKYIDCLRNSKQREIINYYLDLFKKTVLPLSPLLRQSFVHNDANDYNLICRNDEVTGIIDFGDSVYSYAVNEPAVAVAYAMLGKVNPIRTMIDFLDGYTQEYSLDENDIKLFFVLACIRLCLSVTIASYQKQIEPDNEYLSITERQAWDLLEYLRTKDPQLISAILEHRYLLSNHDVKCAVEKWLKENQEQIGSVTDDDLYNTAAYINLRVDSPGFNDLHKSKNRIYLSDSILSLLKDSGKSIGVTEYGEARIDYLVNRIESDLTCILTGDVSLGVNIYCANSLKVNAPLDGVVHSVDTGKDILILKHEISADNISFYTLYRGLDNDSLGILKKDEQIKRGDSLGIISREDSSAILPDLHLQVVCDPPGLDQDIPTHCHADIAEYMKDVVIDPQYMLKLPESFHPPIKKKMDKILEIRNEHIGKSLSISYQEPLKIVRGWMQYLIDDTGRVFLDAVNNVPHVGHSHPRVTRAAQDQMAVLNTNTRYLHDYLVDYSQQLLSKFPGPLNVCYFACSGSEANELALRLARTHTGREDIIVVDGAYHGNTSSLIDISSYKFDGPGGKGAPPHVHKVAMPDVYRGIYRGDHPHPGKAYAELVKNKIEDIHSQGINISAFICESLLGCGGQIVLPEDYLSEAFKYVRKTGGVCIADEVQVGFGRVGSHFWGFETQNVIPDIVTLGKPIGNGHPLSAVITTEEIANSFANGMEYFNTYGGNPVSCAIGKTVLDVIEEEQLQQNAYEVGNYCLSELKMLRPRHKIIGDVRGLGLFIGVELVRDHETLEPAAAEADLVVNKMRERGVLLSTDGPLHNVLKFKPPMVFSRENVDCLVNTLDYVLTYYTPGA